MRIQQSAFKITNSLATFVGIVAFDADKQSALSAAKELWGSAGMFREIDAHELLGYTRNGCELFCGTCQ